jgi:hypothetical protein
MMLTPGNKQEIADYIGGVIRYQETFDEVYDHILSGVCVCHNPEFSISNVREIVEVDFGGLQQITENEKEYERTFLRSCMRDLKEQMLRSFKFPAILIHVFLLLVCVFVFQYSAYFSVGIREFAEAILLGLIVLSGIYLFNRYVYRRTQKPSIKFKFIEWAVCICSAFSFNMTMLFLNKNSIFELSPEVKFLIAAAMFLTLTNFLIAYYKVYHTRLRILA